MTLEKSLSSQQHPAMLSGTVVSGSGKAAFFTQLDWVKHQCAVKLGFEPYPGTLNISLSSPDLLMLLLSITDNSGIPLVPPDVSNCLGRAHPVRIGAIPGAIIFPGESARRHDSHIVEILAPVCLRETLNLVDGDWISITLVTREATG